MTNSSWLTDMPLLASDFSGLDFVAIAMLLAAVCIVLSLIAIVLLLLAAYRLCETTLVAPLVWAMLSLGLWAYGVAAPQRDAQGTPLSSDRQTILILALFSMVCPTIAVLGARRPQNRVWPLVVASLLFILILPELPAVLGQGDRQLAHGVWKWFYAGLLLVGWINYLPTRLGLAATLWSLPGLAWFYNDSSLFWWCMFVPAPAAILAVMSAKRWSSARSAPGWNLVWCDFRNFYGVVWSLRVMERANALAKSTGATILLDWSGFHPLQQQDDLAKQLGILEPGLRNLFRRFVSDAWIDARLTAANTATPPVR